jgi:hypothetical protein
MKGTKKRAYFSHQRLKLERLTVCFSSRALAILTRHFSCSFATRSSAAPRTVMMTAAKSPKEPSQ